MRVLDPAFEVPDVREVADLTAASTRRGGLLLPEDRVYCVNRGRKTLIDKFDGRDTAIPPGRFLMEYGRAKHFQRKCIVPGTRNLEVGGYVSWIGILGSEDGRIAVDAPEECLPFSDDELQVFGEKVEAIDRDALSNPADRDVMLIRTRGMTGLRRGPGSVRPVIETREQASDGAREAAAHVFEPSTEPNAAKLDQATFRGEVQDAAMDGTVPQPRPMRSQRPR